MSSKVVAKSSGSLFARFAEFLQPRAAKIACRAVCVGLTVLLLPSASAAVTAMLADLSLEQLMNESVTSVSKKETKLNDAPAAISVITADDLARLGITTIPEALRLVPGLDVARMDASRWAISSRGFNFGYANKLLVLMDGRSLYTPSFGGVQWGDQDLMLEDLDRIEVIRGPGATLWGANAVNGVINITSKSSRDTQGMLVSTALGSDEQTLTSIRYGGQVNPQIHYRTYLKYFNRDDFSLQSGGNAGDGWDAIRGGFRTDWDATEQDLVTLQGDIYSAGAGENVSTPQLTPPFSTEHRLDNSSRGGNLLGRWTRTLSETSHLSAQAYFDYFRAEVGDKRESRRTADIEFEYRFAAGTRNDLVWGAGYRFTTDKLTNSPSIHWDPPSRDLNLYNTFLQDEITLVPDRLRFTIGSKFERNDYTGWELQPGARLLWTPHSQHTVWASVSHAVSTPNRVTRDGRVTIGVSPTEPGGPVLQTDLVGNDGVVSEALDAFELGYRVEVTPELSFDLAAFYNRYDKLVGVTPGSPDFVADPQPRIELPLTLENLGSGETYGAELSVQWKPLDYWKLTANYSLLRMRMQPDKGASRSSASPQQQVGLRSYLTLPWNLELNGAACFVDQVTPYHSSGANVDIPAYLRADIGLLWHASPSLDVGIWGYNLLDGSHPEFTSRNSNQITEVPRSIMVKLTWRF